MYIRYCRVSLGGRTQCSRKKGQKILSVLLATFINPLKVLTHHTWHQQHPPIHRPLVGMFGMALFLLDSF